MTKKPKSANDKKYLEAMFPTPDKTTQETRITEALKHAHEIRKFEIGLYWQRAIYFWGFQAAIFIGYAEFSHERAHSSYYYLMFSILGFITSFAWVLVNRGSKFWQENWELHIDQLEETQTGNLYKTILCKENGYQAAFSVSKVNQLVAGSFVVIWGTILFLCLDTIFKRNSVYIICGISILALVFITFKFLRTNFKHGKFSVINYSAKKEITMIQKTPKAK